jgi:hypothetical protein
VAEGAKVLVGAGAKVDVEGGTDVDVIAFVGVLDGTLVALGCGVEVEVLVGV